MDRHRPGCHRHRYRHHHRYRRRGGHDASPACLLAAGPAARPRRDHRNRRTGRAGRGAHRHRQLRGTSGVANLVSRTPVGGNGFFRIGSDTKTFISVVVLQLAAEHRLSLDDTVGHWLPGVVHGNGNDGSKITIRELLQHTSGLHNYTDDLQAQITSLKAYRQLEFHQFSRIDLLKIALAHKPDFAPGTGWHYSNTNYILLGMIIEKVTQRPLGEPGRPPDRGTARPPPHVRAGDQHPATPATRHRYLFFSKNTRIDTTAENMSWAARLGG